MITCFYDFLTSSITNNKDTYNNTISCTIDKGVPTYIGDIFEFVAVPKSQIRELFELKSETVKFEKPEPSLDGQIRVTIKIIGKGSFKGVGKNY
ncbi:hypothetical protein I4U23_024177 [Adineta vaga]|nr:hypothetical protein I4U23_024177 [Adineta vaga]